jgi:hypothetical protein
MIIRENVTKGGSINLEKKVSQGWTGRDAQDFGGPRAPTVSGNDLAQAGTCLHGIHYVCQADPKTVKLENLQVH